MRRSLCFLFSVVCWRMTFSLCLKALYSLTPSSIIFSARSSCCRAMLLKLWDTTEVAPSFDVLNVLAEEEMGGSGGAMDLTLGRRALLAPPLLTFINRLVGMRGSLTVAAVVTGPKRCRYSSTKGDRWAEYFWVTLAPC